MDTRLSPTPPPAYGSVVNPIDQQPGAHAYPPPSGPPLPPGTGYVNAGFPQPGEYAGGPLPNEPPPKYEPSKDTANPNPAGYQYPPTGYQQVYPGQQTVILQDPGFTGFPKTTQCPSCRALITTGIEHKPGGLTWLASGLICIFGCWLGCCLLPFCMPELQDVEHRCPNCNYVLGIYHRM